MNSPTKRRRVAANPRFIVRLKKRVHIWVEVLRVWTKLTLHGSPKDQSSSRFIIFCGQPSETIVETRVIDTEGQHSEISEIFLNGQQQDVIMKRFITSDPRNASPLTEASLQSYASHYGFAPPVYAFNNVAMISAKCEQPIDEESLENGYTWIRGMSKRPQLRKVRNQLSTLNRILGKSIQDILQFTRHMYAKIGMYNKDPNVDNYMIYNGKLVQIDFGMNRFKDKAAYQTFLKHILDKKITTEDALVPKDMPAYPPDFYWYETFMSDGKSDHSAWSKEEWNTFHLKLPHDRQVFIRQMEKAKQEILAEQAKQNETSKHSNQSKAQFKTLFPNNRQ